MCSAEKYGAASTWLLQPLFNPFYYNDSSRKLLSEMKSKYNFIPCSYRPRTTVTSVPVPLYLHDHHLRHLSLRGLPYSASVVQNFVQNSDHEQQTQLRTGETKHRCFVCSRYLSTRGNLTVHMRIHTKERRYTCQMCPKNFRTSDHLTRHVRTHTGEKPYSCSVCSRRFTQSSNYKTHMRIHTKERPYCCSECPLTFSDKSNLIHHVDRHHSRMDNK